MIDLRLWRIALLLVPIAVTVAMFSLQEVPEAREPAIAPDAYDGAAAATLADELAESYPEPHPGSDRDQAVAELVHARFSALQGPEVAEQVFEHDGKELRNLIAVLPGPSERKVALLAHRDAAGGSGAATSLASTAILLEIANSISGSTHEKTLVFVSTDGGSLGAAGARRFLEDYSEIADLDAVIVLSQPASPDPSPPLVIPWSSGPQSTAIELAETANATVTAESGQAAGNETPLSELFRLALPAGLGEQAPLVEGGLDAIRISSEGERPLPPAQDQPSEVSPGSVDRFGRAALALILALDAAPSPLEHGPGAYIGLAGNLLPGWALAMVALALLLPVALAAIQGLGSSARSPAEALASTGWALRRAVPFLGALLAVYVLDWVGLVPDPPFPFDPEPPSLGLGGRIGVTVALGVLGVGIYLLSPLRPPPPSAAAAAAPATMTLASLAVFGVWLANPYLALLLALGLNAWLIAAMPSIPGRLAAASIVALGAVPLLLAVGDLAGRLGEGPGVIWSLLFMVTDGQISLWLALLACLLAGLALAIVALSGPVRAAPAPQIRVLERLRRRRDRDGDEHEGERPEPAAEQPDPSVYW